MDNMIGYIFNAMLSYEMDTAAMKLFLTKQVKVNKSLKRTILMGVLAGTLVYIQDHQEISQLSKRVDILEKELKKGE